MSKRVLRILGLEGRTTIPFELRERMGFACGDVISFTQQDEDTILLRRERLCDNCSGQNAAALRQPEPTLLELLDSLTPSQQRAALVHLSVKWAEQHDKNAYLNVGA